MNIFLSRRLYTRGIKVEGQYSLALMKQQRKSTKKEAKQLLEEATSKGFARAQCSLASMHLDDIFDETSFEDYSRPLELFRLAAEQGLAQDPCRSHHLEQRKCHS